MAVLVAESRNQIPLLPIDHAVSDQDDRGDHSSKVAGAIHPHADSDLERCERQVDGAEVTAQRQRRLKSS